MTTYGGELLGTNKQEVKELQKWIDLGMCWLVKARGTHRTISKYALGQELGIPVLTGRFVFSRLRAFVQWKNAKTRVADIVNATPPTTRKWTWSRGTKMLVTRHAELMTNSDGMVDLHRHKFGVFDYYDKRDRDYKTTLSQEYITAGFGYTRFLIRNSLYYPEAQKGLMWLVRARCGKIWTPRTAAEANLIPRELGDYCLVCRRRTEGDLLHIILDCVGFSGLRERCQLEETFNMLQEYVLDEVIEVGNVGVRTHILRTLLGGSSYGGDTGYFYLSPQPQVGDGFEIPAVWLTVALYLQGSIPLMQKCIWEFAEGSPPGLPSAAVTALIPVRSRPTGSGNCVSQPSLSTLLLEYGESYSSLSTS
jgi:hypothetical protein